MLGLFIIYGWFIYCILYKCILVFVATLVRSEPPLPFQEMIHLSIARHMRRFCASLVMFGTSILVMLFLPSRIIKRVFPTFLPYITSQNK